MSVRTRQAFRSSFGSSVPVIAPLYSARCETWALNEDGVFSCGSTSECALRLDAAGIEPLHCCFQLQHGTLTVRRERGRVWVNDLPVSNEAFLSPGDVLTLGPVSFFLDKADRELLSAAEVLYQSAAVTPSASSAAYSAPAQMLQETNRIDVAHGPSFAVTSPASAGDELLKTIELRERQLQDRAASVEERERQLLECQHRQEELGKFLAEQESLFAQKQQLLVSNEASLRKQKEEIEQRVRLLSDREQQLSRQMEDSAQAYGELEASRLKLNEELERVARREATAAEQLDELKRASRQVEEHQIRLMEDQDAITRWKNDVEARESQVVSETERVQRQEAELQCLAEELLARRLELETLQNHLQTEASEVRTRMESREQIASHLQCRLAEAESLRVSEREQLEAMQHSLEETSRCLTEKSDELKFMTERLELSESLVQDLRNQLENQQHQFEELQTQRPSGADRSRETRTIEQLAAIAAEREAALRARQEAFVIQGRIDEAREKLAADEARLQTWQEEIDQRYNEVASRVVSLKAARQKTSRPVGLLNTVQSAANESSDLSTLPLETESLRSEWQSLQALRDEMMARDAALRVAESRLAEREEVAQTIQTAAATERETLAALHGELLSEKDAHQQRSQELTNRETELLEREILVSHQTEEIRERSDTVIRQVTELRGYEEELNSRAAELHRKIVEWKAASREEINPHSPADQQTHLLSEMGTASSETPSQSDEQWHELLSQNEVLIRERDALMTAIRELQRVLLDARSDVEEASRISAASIMQEQTIAQLYQQIEVLSNQLQLSESRVHQLVRELEETRHHQELSQEAVQSGSSAAFAQDDANDAGLGVQDADEPESRLLSRIENLRSEMNISAAENTSRQFEYTSLISDRDSRIRELEELVSGLREALMQRGETSAESFRDAVSDSGAELETLREQLQREKQVLQDRDDLIRELRSRLMQQSDLESVPLTANSEDGSDWDTLRNEADDLDRRTQLLNSREEEMLERSRRIEQSEENVEAQRRQLQEARQQLEIARAEIQQAMQESSASRFSSDLLLQPLDAALVTKSEEPELALASEQADREQTSFSFGMVPALDEGSSADDLRSELASLFGLKKAVPEPSQAPSLSGPLVTGTDFVDLTEASGQPQAVALTFGEDASSLVETRTPASAAEEEPVREENSEDFVRDYMEQLLARSRKSAGNALPSELKSSESKKSGPGQQPVAAQVKKTEPAPTKKEGPKVKSFIEEYMAGGFGDLTGDGEIPTASPVVPGIPSEDDVTVVDEPRAPRQKMDLQKLREDMDSFRTLSTQSVENALVDHAIRRERHSINGRIMFVAVLTVMTLFLAVANFRGIIDKPSVTWGCLVAAIGAAAELARKYVSLKARCRIGLQGECREAEEKEMRSGSDDEIRQTLDEETAVSAEALQSQPVAVLDLAEESTQPESGLPFRAQSEEAEERGQYFEL
ncbi:MAG: FHA domain-containing protein [Planctomycetota bacterium]